MIILKSLQDRIDSIFDKLDDPEQNIKWSYSHHLQLKHEVEQCLKRIKTIKRMLKQNYLNGGNYQKEYDVQFTKATELNDQRLVRSIVESKQLIYTHDDNIKKQFDELVEAEQKLNRSSNILNIRLLILKLNMELINSDYEVTKTKMHLLEDINQLNGEIKKSSLELSYYMKQEKAIKENQDAEQRCLLQRLYKITQELERYWGLVSKENEYDN